MPVYSISINNELARVVEKEMKMRKFANKSEFFRELIRMVCLPKKQDYIIEEVAKDDPDYERAVRLRETGKFVPLKSLIK